MDNQQSKISLRDLVTLSRVQTQVNKTAVLAFHKLHNDENNVVKFPTCSIMNDLSTNGLKFSSRKNSKKHVKGLDDDTSQIRFLRLNFKDVSRRL